MTAIDTQTQASQSAILSVRNLVKSFGGLKAINDVSFEARAGEVTALIGPNGAGKTTVFNLVTNIMGRDAGRVTFAGARSGGAFAGGDRGAGIDPHLPVGAGFSRHDGDRERDGRRPSPRPSFAAEPVAVAAGRARARSETLRRRAEEMLELVGLSLFAETHATELPMGAQKLLEVVRALMAQPKLLCLDEPAAGLNDTETEGLANLLRAIRKLGIPVLVVEHNMSLVMNVADRIVVLDSGAIIATGAPSEVQSNSRVIEAYLGREGQGA